MMVCSPFFVTNLQISNTLWKCLDKVVTRILHHGTYCIAFVAWDESHVVREQIEILDPKRFEKLPTFIQAIDEKMVDFRLHLGTFLPS